MAFDFIQKLFRPSSVSDPVVALEKAYDEQQKVEAVAERAYTKATDALRKASEDFEKNPTDKNQRNVHEKALVVKKHEEAYQQAKEKTMKTHQELLQRRAKKTEPVQTITPMPPSDPAADAVKQLQQQLEEMQKKLLATGTQPQPQFSPQPAPTPVASPPTSAETPDPTYYLQVHLYDDKTLRLPVLESELEQTLLSLKDAIAIQGNVYMINDITGVPVSSILFFDVVESIDAVAE